MAIVLAATGLFLYLRLGSHLALALDRELRLRAQDLTALVSQPDAALLRDGRSRFIERGENYAQLLTPGGRVLDGTEPLGDTPVVTQKQIEAALHGPIYADKQSVPGLDESSRLLATAVKRGDRRLVLVVGATRAGSSRNALELPRRAADRRSDRADSRVRGRLFPRRASR